ncbi:MAG: ABC transporter permease [Solirubrobacteraceae bacterium]|nr:ABC transporter permease [Solirubrobacteraceae bacterium]
MPSDAPVLKSADEVVRSTEARRGLDVAAVRFLVVRGLNELLRVPGAAIPGIVSPAIFLIGLVLVFGKATDIPGYGTSSFLAFVLPVALLQSAGFTGGATGVNLGRDIEGGWLDRLLLSPASRGTILAGLVLSASLRVLIPIPPLLVIAIAVGAPAPSLLGLVITFALVIMFTAVASTWASILALIFKSQQASPLMQSSILSTLLFSASYAPLELLQPWMRTIAEHNPITLVVEGLRQCYVGEITWTVTWHAFAALIVMGALFAVWALAKLKRYER